MALDAKETSKRFCPLNSEVLDIRLNSFLNESVSSCSVPRSVSPGEQSAANKILRTYIRVLDCSFKSPSAILMRLILSLRILVNCLRVLVSELSSSVTDLSAPLVSRSPDTTLPSDSPRLRLITSSSNSIYK